MKKNSLRKLTSVGRIAAAILFLTWQSSCLQGGKVNDNDYLLKVCDGQAEEMGTPCGYATQDGEMVVPIGRYLHCYTDTLRTYAIVLKEKGECVAIDKSGEEIYGVYWYDNGPDYISDGLFRILQNGKIGYADEQGAIQIAPQYECADPFEGGKARVALDCRSEADGEHTIVRSDAWFYIDKQGNRIEQ